MAEGSRFKKLEPKAAPLPETVKLAIARLKRFGHLEIASAASAAGAAATPRAKRKLCAHCGQGNEAGREICWACFKPMSPVPLKNPRPEPGQEIHLLLDGVSYKSSDPDLPEDICDLMSRIREEGFSEKLLKAWSAERSKSAAAGARARGPQPAQRFPVDLFDGKYVDILRMDGRMYRSDDRGLPPEIKEIFGFVEKEGVTPALLQHLRLYGTTVKFRPFSTPTPSDGELDFWNAARTSTGD